MSGSPSISGSWLTPRPANGKAEKTAGEPPSKPAAMAMGSIRAPC